MEHVLALDESTDVLEEADLKVLNDEKLSAEKGKLVREKFRQEYFVKAATVSALLAAVAHVAKGAGKRGRGPGKGGRGGGGPGGGGDLADDITQAHANFFIPPGSCIWCGHERQSWCGHMPPFCRFSQMWHMLKIILVHLG